MSKRFIGHIDDGAPGEDDARYGPYNNQQRRPQQQTPGASSSSAPQPLPPIVHNAPPQPPAHPLPPPQPFYHHGHQQGQYQPPQPQLLPPPPHFRPQPPPFSHGPPFPYTSQQPYPYAFQQPYPPYPPSQHAPGYAGPQSQGQMGPPPPPPFSAPRYVPAFIEEPTHQAPVPSHGPPQGHTFPFQAQRPAYPPIPAGHRPQATQFPRPQYQLAIAGPSGHSNDDDDDDDENNPDLVPMYIPRLCSTPQPAHMQSAESRVIDIIRPPSPVRRPIIALPARALGSERAMPLGPGSSNPSHPSNRTMGRIRRRVPRPARGANEGVGPNGPPIPRLTLFPATDNQTRAEPDDEEDMGEEYTIGDDPNDESTFFRVTDENRDDFFRECFGRTLNVVQPIYQLPLDADENKRQEYFHKLMYMILGDKIYTGPMEEVLSAPARRQRRVLDIGCGGGMWAMQLADDFPEVEVIGCDLAPVQPEMVPPNLTFELFDAQLNPYPNEYFDVVHARGVHTGIRNYPLFLEEVARVLAPGGLLILIESEMTAMTANKQPILPGPRGGAPGWYSFWEQYEICVRESEVDTSVPTRLPELLRVSGAFDDIVAKEACYPIGFWPRENENLVAVGEHGWMDHDFLLPACEPMFRNFGLTDFRTRILIEDAQQDLYYPLTRPYGCVHVTHCRKIPTWRAPRRRSRRLI